MSDTIDADARTAITKDFHDAVNMSASELEKWLATPESAEVGWKGEDGHGSGESVGHKSGTRIVDCSARRKPTSTRTTSRT